MEIEEVVKMTPQAQEIVLRAIHEVNQKSLSEAKLEGKLEGKREARAEMMIEFAKTFKNQVDINELSAFTGLSIDEINKL